jgi:hypothetical protein
MPAIAMGDFVRATGLPPDIIQGFVERGLIDGHRDGIGVLWFPVTEVDKVEKLKRLRAEKSLHYASMGLVLNALDHVEELKYTRRKDMPWT